MYHSLHITHGRTMPFHPTIHGHAAHSHALLQLALVALAAHVGHRHTKLVHQSVSNCLESGGGRQLAACRGAVCR